MNPAHHDLLDKYKSMRWALEKEKTKRLHLQERVKKLEQNVTKSKATNAKLGGI